MNSGLACRIVGAATSQRVGTAGRRSSNRNKHLRNRHASIVWNRRAPVPGTGTRQRLEPACDRSPKAHTIGKSAAPIIVAMSPVRPTTMLMGVRYRRLSRSVKPLICVITQNALSFIHQIGFDPQPMARAR